MEQFRNIGIIGRLGSSQVLDTIRRLKNSSSSAICT